MRSQIGMDNSVVLEYLKEKALQTRKDILRMFMVSGNGHFGGSLSCVEIVTSLYFKIMNIDPKNPQWEDRDRFVISKGHGAPTVYSALAQLGFFPDKWLDEYESLGANLNTHPNMMKIPGMDMSTGSLGHGLSIGVGMAIAAKINSKQYMTYVLLGDGELNEGAIWEAAMSASKFKLDNLIVFVDRNRLCVGGCTEDVMPVDPLDKKWESFGWTVNIIDGHDFSQILNAVDEAAASNDGKPKVIIANTIKGKGISFMENQREWHGHAITPEQFKKAMEELNDKQEGSICNQ